MTPAEMLLPVTKTMVFLLQAGFAVAFTFTILNLAEGLGVLSYSTWKELLWRSFWNREGWPKFANPCTSVLRRIGLSWAYFFLFPFLICLLLFPYFVTFCVLWGAP